MLVVKSKKALVLKVRDVERITTLIPKSKVLKPNVVAVKHGVEEVRVLRNLGFNPPSPILYYYDWPGMYKPFKAQETTADFLTSHGRAFCLNDLGTGKSLSTLWAYDYLRSKNLAGKVLIVSPLSTLERTWADELFRHFSHLTYAVLHGSRDKRVKLLSQDVDVYIINHDGVEIIADAMKNRLDITHVVIDEIAQVARNAGTDRWKALNLVINKQTPRQAWGLTGTPTPNLPTDAWAQCRLLVPNQVPPYFNRFKDMVLRQVGPFTWLPRENATEVVKDAMQPSIRFSRDECVDLPPCLYETRQVELTAEQDKAYKQMMARLAAEVDSGEIVAVNEAVKMSKLLQIGCGVAYDTNGDEVSIPSHNRLQAVLDIVEDTPYKVIVFVPFISAVNKVADFLTSKQVSIECIHGGVSKAERDRIFSAFQKQGEPKVIVAQPAAMSHGLTLTAASTIVWFAPHTSNEVFEQANGRITRPGQKNNQFIVMLEGTAVERRLYERLKNKQKSQGLLLSMVKESRK
jgi:SNF2 family DNA or RNA helicase